MVKEVSKNATFEDLERVLRMINSFDKERRSSMIEHANIAVKHADFCIRGYYSLDDIREEDGKMCILIAFHKEVKPLTGRLESGCLRSYYERQLIVRVKLGEEVRFDFGEEFNKDLDVPPIMMNGSDPIICLQNVIHQIQCESCGDKTSIHLLYLHDILDIAYGTLSTLELINVSTTVIDVWNELLSLEYTFDGWSKIDIGNTVLTVKVHNISQISSRHNVTFLISMATDDTVCNQAVLELDFVIYESSSDWRDLSRAGEYSHFNAASFWNDKNEYTYDWCSIYNCSVAEDSLFEEQLKRIINFNQSVYPPGNNPYMYMISGISDYIRNKNDIKEETK